MNIGKGGRRTGQKEICLHKIDIALEVKDNRAVEEGGVRGECCSLDKALECGSRICGSLMRICLLIRSSLGNGCSYACSGPREGLGWLMGFLCR